MDTFAEWAIFHLEMALPGEGWGLEDQPVPFQGCVWRGGLEGILKD